MDADPTAQMTGPARSAPGRASRTSRAARGARVVAVLGLVATWLAVGALPAAADPAGPTNFRSELGAVVFTDEGAGRDEAASAPDIELEIVGGDAYLVLRNLGREVLVPGYDGEPYLRFESDGRVLVNDRSPARWLNDARFGAAEVEVPAGASADAEPSWRPVATGGEWSWHDHRIHFMSPTLPPQVDTARATPQPVLDWEVPFEVDGRPAVATGLLQWVPGPNPVVPIGLLLAAVAGAATLVWRGPGVLGGATAVSGVLTLGVGVAATVSMPTGADVEPALIVLPGVGLVVLAAAARIGRTGAAGAQDSRARLLSVGAGIPVGIWGLVQSGALTRPIVPGPLPTPVVAIVATVALAVGVAAVIALARAGLEATRVEVD